MAEVDSLTIAIEGTSDIAAKNINNLVTSLNNLRSAASGGAGLSSVAKQLQNLATSLSGISGDSGSKIRSFVSALSSLRELSGLKISSSIGNQLASLATSISKIQWTDGDKIVALANGLRPLSDLGKANLQSFISQLGKLPEVIQSLDAADLGRFAEQMRAVTAAIQPLATEMQKVASGFSAFPERIQRIIQENDRLVTSNARTGKSFGSLGEFIRSTQARFGIYLVLFRRIAHIMGNWVKESNAYVENLNLFTVTMGDAADAALKYAETVKEALGIDPSDWIRNQGMFKQITSGFGVVEEGANIMSKNLTQLGYDISSFYNIPIADAMQKLQSAIAGELEPLRRLGYATDVATLKQVALRHGITQNVNSMDQAQKSQLRYIAIMEQSKNVMGDMARTINTPANAMRILGQQFTQLSRAAGNLLIPALQTIIPVAQAIVEVVTEVVQAIANLLGFELPKIDYSGIGAGFSGVASDIGDVASGADNAAGAIGGAADAAKELKRQLIGIDELTVLESPDSGGGGGGGGGGGAGGGGIGGSLFDNLPQYDFLKGLNESLDETKNKVKDILYKYVLPLSAVLAALGVGRLIKSLGDSLSKLSKLKKAFATIVTLALEFAVNKWSMENFIGASDIRSGLKYLLLDIFSTSVASYLLYRMIGAKGLVLGVGVGIVANAVGISLGIAKGAKYDDAKTWIATALNVALGGVGGAIGLSKLGLVGKGGGFVIGASFALSLSLTAVNFGAIASGQLDPGSWRSVLMSIGSTLAAGLGGTLLAGAAGLTGPVGFAIGIGVGLIMNIVSAVIADNKRIESVVIDAIRKSFSGTVTLTDMEVKFEGLSEAVSSGFQSMAESGNQIETVKDRISETIESVNLLNTEIAIDAVDIDDNIEAIKSSFESLRDDAKQIFEETRNIIITGLAGAIGETASAAGVEMPKMAALVNGLADAAIEYSEGLTTELTELTDAYKNGEIDMETYSARYIELTKKYQELVGDTTAVDNFSNAIGNWKASMDLSDIVTETGVNTEALSGILSGFETSYNETISAIDSGTQGIEDSFERLVSSAEARGEELSDTALKDIATTLLGAESTRTAQIQEMGGYYSQVIDTIQQVLFSGLEDEVSALEQDYESKSPIYKFFTDEESYVANGLKTYKSNVVDPILGELQSSMDRIGVDGNLWAGDAIQDVLNGLINIKYDEYGATVSRNLNDIGTLMQTALGDVSTTTVPAAKTTGGDIASGILSGNEEWISAHEREFKNVIGRLPEFAIAELEIGSPSKVFEEIGGYAMEGLLDGFDSKDISKHFEKIFESIQKAFESAPDTFQKVFTTAFQNAKNAWQNVSSTFRTYANNIVGAFNNLPSQIRTKFSTAYSNATGAWSNAGTDFSKIGTTIANSISIDSNTIKTNLNNSLKPAFQSVSDNAKNWGQDICLSLASGMTSQYAKRKVQNAAQEVGNVIKNNLGFSEPKEGPLSDFHTYMPDMIKLMVSGIRENTDKVVRAVRDLSTQMSQGIQETELSAPYSASDISAYSGRLRLSAQESAVYERSGAELSGMTEQNEDVINTLLAISQQIIAAINRNGERPIMMDGRRVTSETISMNNRLTRIYGKSLQKA